MTEIIKTAIVGNKHYLIINNIILDKVSFCRIVIQMSTEVKIENNLFNEKKMEEFIDLYDDMLVVISDEDLICKWIGKLNNDELISEKTNYIRFFRIILEDILGYKLEDIEHEENIGKEFCGIISSAFYHK